MAPIYAYVLALIVFVVIDLIWLGFIARDFYFSELRSLMAPQINMVAAGAFYLLYPAGVVIFAVMPGLEAQSVVKAVVLGSLLGLLAYGTYDLTNLATVKGWPVRMAIVDIAWGSVLTGLTAGITAAVLTRAG